MKHFVDEVLREKSPAITSERRLIINTNMMGVLHDDTERFTPKPMRDTQMKAQKLREYWAKKKRDK